MSAMFINIIMTYLYTVELAADWSSVMISVAITKASKQFNS